jgi:hypothetical protein
MAVERSVERSRIRVRMAERTVAEDEYVDSVLGTDPAGAGVTNGRSPAVDLPAPPTPAAGDQQTS